jgi:uncharacterized lipoprotein YehR (DUF1307 family)
MAKQVKTRGNAKQAVTASVQVNGKTHVVTKASNGDIIVNHPNAKKTTFKKIDLTKKADVQTVAQGVAAVKKWHKTHPTKGR